MLKPSECRVAQGVDWGAVMLTYLVNRASMALGRLAGPPASVRLPRALAGLYGLKNGFRALDDALLVLPAESVGSLPGVEAWNATDGWKRWFDVDAALTFFAMDAVMRQFGVDRSGRVFVFDPTDASVTFIAEDLDAWADAMLRGGAGQSLTRHWKQLHGPLDTCDRLAPGVLGGRLAVMHLVDAMESLGERSEELEIPSREVALYDVAW